MPKQLHVAVRTLAVRHNREDGPVSSHVLLCFEFFPHGRVHLERKGSGDGRGRRGLQIHSRISVCNCSTRESLVPLTHREEQQIKDFFATLPNSSVGSPVL
jgi:hypothetical protein